jgi:hypothetical protein
MTMALGVRQRAIAEILFADRRRDRIPRGTSAAHMVESADQPRDVVRMVIGRRYRCDQSDIRGRLTECGKRDDRFLTAGCACESGWVGMQQVRCEEAANLLHFRLARKRGGTTNALNSVGIAACKQHAAGAH